MTLYINEYLEKIELNKNDPDYQIEDFWYGFKKSMINFYRHYEIEHNKIEEWSNLLNNYKNKKQYELIEASIKDYISFYAIDIMRYDDFENKNFSNILLKNIKRWKEISNKFHFGDSDKNKKIYMLFEAFNCVKSKEDEKLFIILEIFQDLYFLLCDDYDEMICTSFELGQIKVLECIENIIGKEKILDCLNKQFVNSNFTNNDYKISYLKLYKKYIKRNLD